MNNPDRSHVRIFHDEIYIERVPNAWVLVGSRSDWDSWDEPARRFMVSKALKKGLDCTLPAPKNSSQTELPPIE